MRARRWSSGLAGAGAVLGLALPGCGSSNDSKGTPDAAAEASDDGGSIPCTPEAVNPADSGACTSCISAMCGAQLMACNTDCTCGTTVNTLTTCLASQTLPSLDAGAAGLGVFLTGGGGLATCLLQLTGGIGGLGGLAGGGSGGGGTSTATIGFVSCLLGSCRSDCLPASPAVDGGAEAGVPEASAPEAGVPEASAPDAPVSEGSSNDAQDSDASGSSPPDASDGG